MKGKSWELYSSVNHNNQINLQMSAGAQRRQTLLFLNKPKTGAIMELFEHVRVFVFTIYASN